MTSAIRKAIVFGFGVLVAASGVAHAETLEVNVPFAFTVNGQRLPAGSYRVEPQKSSASVLLIRGAEGTRGVAFVLATPAVGQNPGGRDAALIFTPNDNTYELTGVWNSQAEGFEIPASNDEPSRVAQTVVYATRVS